MIAAISQSMAFHSLLANGFEAVEKLQKDQSKLPALNNLPVNWFDAVFVAVLVFGLWRGRRNGMTKECLPTFQWLALFLVCGMGYTLIVPTCAALLQTGKLASALLAYFALAVAIWVVFSILKQVFVPLLTGSNVFGGGEYYLGMFSGVIHFGCMLLVALALLNAPYYTPADIQAKRAYNNRWFGGGQKGYSGDFIPSLPTVQEAVFKKSFTGPFVTNYLGTLLIDTAPPPAVKQPQKKPVTHLKK